MKENQDNFDPNVRDRYGATPLHYAIMSIEDYNMQALLSLGAEINHQDNFGDSILHLAIVRYIADQDNFDTYKAMLKQMLKFGAERNLKNKNGLRPIEILNQNRHAIKLQTKEDYLKFEESFDEGEQPENQYKKFEFYLGVSHKENKLCCPKHAPLYKVKRSKSLMIWFILMNLFVLLMSSLQFYGIFTNLREQWEGETFHREEYWIIL